MIRIVTDLLKMLGGDTVITTQDIIDNLQRKIMLHSYIYYELDDCVISDHDYDNLGHQLVRYKEEYPDLWKKSKYYKQFGDEYNGSTGFDLYSKLEPEQKTIIQHIAQFRHKII